MGEVVAESRLPWTESAMPDDDLSRLLRGEATERSEGASSEVSRPRDLGLSKLARALSKRPSMLFGKWCSRCRGIWYGLPLESECPVCGNRHG